MTGTAEQIEWAERIKPLVNAEFDRVSVAFKSVAAKQSELARVETDSIIAILEEKRLEVIANTEAAYFIREWRELRDQVRQMIVQDPRYEEIKAKR